MLLELSRDETGLAELLGGEDTHTKNQIAFALPSRLIAKIYLFRTIYRGSGWSFANDPDFMHVSTSPKFWDGLNEKFYAKYAGIDACHNKWCADVVQGLPIVGPLGRSWSISMARNDKGELKIPWTVLTNYPVQGTGADVMTLARIMAYKRIKANATLASLVKFISTVHDSIVVDVPSHLIQRVVDIFHGVFKDIQKTIKANFGYDWIVPMDCECKAGMNMKNRFEKVGDKMVEVNPGGMEKVLAST